MNGISDDLVGKVVVVTGAAAGIGRGVVGYAAAKHAHVVIADVDGAAADVAAQSIVASGGSAEAHEVDVCSYSAMEELAKKVFEAHGHVDLLVNNAGIESHGLLWEHTPATFQRLMDINVVGVFNGIHAFVPRLVAGTKEAHVVVVSSTGGLGARGLMAPYMASKHALLGLAESLDMEFREFAPHLKAAAFIPLTVRSQIFLSADASDCDGPGARQREAMQRRNVRDGLEPEEAAAILFAGLASDDLWIHTNAESSLRRVQERADAITTGVRVELPTAPK